MLKNSEENEARAEQAENATKSERTLISANSFEELFQKIGDYLQNEKVDSVRTQLYSFLIFCVVRLVLNMRQLYSIGLLSLCGESIS